MPSRLRSSTVPAFTAYVLLAVPTLLALDPHRALTQYVRTAWSQADGLPQDTIRRITQTTDGYLWLATDEGLTRFDGYDFVTFTKNNSSLPSNSITGLTAGRDGVLWIGTSAGLIRYHRGQFKVFTTKDGLPDNVISYLIVDQSGSLWLAAGIYLSHFDGDSFTSFSADRLLPVQAVRVIYEDRQHVLYYPLNMDDLLDQGVGDPRWSGSTALIGAVVSGQASIVQYLATASVARLAFPFCFSFS